VFELISGTRERALRERSPVSKAVALTLHLAVAAGLVGVMLTERVKVLPAIAPTIMAFVSSPFALPAPAPAPAAQKAARVVEQPTKPAALSAAPIEPQPGVGPETEADHAGAIGGVAGGVDGGIPGGTAGELGTGLVSDIPPPPPAEKPASPVRIGGLIHEPALMHRIEPVYPSFASVSQITGLVILEAVVDEAGCVQSITVLRSRHPLLDNAAMDALRQWRYTPLVLDGVPLSFVLTVTFNFSIQGPHHAH